MPSFKRFRLSLRTRILASIILLLVPTAVLMLNAYNDIRRNVDTMERMIDTPMQEIEFANRLKYQIIQTELPFSQYLNRGEVGDREVFIRLSVEIDRNFENSLAAVSDPAQSDLVKLAKAEWLGAKALGEKLMTKTDIPPFDELSNRMDEFSRHLSRSIAVLDDMANSARAQIGEVRFTAQQEEWESITSLAVIFGIGILLAFFEAFALQQSVLTPIKRLEQTVQKYSQGDLSSRANLKADAEFTHLASAFNLMAERFSNMQSEIDYLSIHDNLTGLYDSTKFHEEMNVEMQRAKRHKREFSLLLIDIDGFNQVNKTYGRLVGDSVLCSVAMQISSAIRPTDIACRYNDDDFAVILSETAAQGAKETAERMAAAISENPINIGDGKMLKVSISVGISTYPIDADIESALFATAAKAMESARNARNHVRLASQK
jgi:diguanylate cyclase (GGDEF)-like protein